MVQKKKQESLRDKDNRHTVLKVPMFRLVAEVLHAQRAAQSAAQKCGFSAVRLQAKGAPAEAAGPASDGLEEVLRAARELGVDVTEK